jgi:cell division protein FtsW (lipid II flippase)
MNNWIATTEVTMGLELFLAATLIMIVNIRYKHKNISQKTFHIQNLEILLLAIILIGVEFLSIEFTFLRNKLLITIIEILIVALTLIIDKKINGKESFIG